VKDDEGRRYFILDLSTNRVNDETYFNDLYDCFNDKVGEAFFNHVYKRNTNKFNPQKFPLTKSKMDSYVKRLDSVYKFIKECYVLEHRSIKIKCSDLFMEYTLYGGDTTKYGREDFHKKMAEAGIIKHKISNWFYVIDHKKLVEIAKKRHWIHELDEFDENEEEEELIETKPKINIIQIDNKETKDIIEEKEEAPTSVVNITIKKEEKKKTKKSKTKRIIESDEE
jgi:hypothetical protein